MATNKAKFHFDFNRISRRLSSTRDSDEFAFAEEGIEEILKLNASYKQKENIKPPYNDGITVAELSVKTVAIGLTTMSMQRDVRKHIPNKEAKLIGMRAAATAVTLSASPDAQRELDATVDKHMPAHIRARLFAAANSKAA